MANVVLPRQGHVWPLGVAIKGGEWSSASTRLLLFRGGVSKNGSGGGFWIDHFSTVLWVSTCVANTPGDDKGTHGISATEGPSLGSSCVASSSCEDIGTSSETGLQESSMLLAAPLPGKMPVA